MIFGVIQACWHPAGVRVLFDRFPGVSLRSTPGYLLSSLRDEKPCFHSEMVLNVRSGQECPLSVCGRPLTPDWGEGLEVPSFGFSKEVSNVAAPPGSLGYFYLERVSGVR